MTRRDIEKLIRDSFDVIVEPRRNGNKFWIRHSEECGPVHYPITAVQFDWLLEGGYIAPDYRVEHNVGLWGADVLIYQGRRYDETGIKSRRYCAHKRERLPAVDFIADDGRRYGCCEDRRTAVY